MSQIKFSNNSYDNYAILTLHLTNAIFLSTIRSDRLATSRDELHERNYWVCTCYTLFQKSYTF